MKNKQTGITLIALIITIVLLLILAGITINALGGGNGLLAKAKWSAYVSEYESVAEAKELYKTEKMIEQIGGTADIYKVASTEVPKISNTNQENMYPIDKQQRIENSSISTTLKNTIMQLEGLTEEEINNEEKVNLYKVDFSKINAEAKKEYVINIVNGNLYSLQYEEYNKKFYHTPRLGVSVVENSKITEPGIYEMVVDAGSVVCWDSIEIYYEEFVENSITCKVYTSDDEINWTEESIGTVNRNELIEKYNITTQRDTQFLKLQVENREINGKNAKVDYIMVNFYKYKEIEIEPEVTVQGVEKQNGMYSIATPSDGQVEATGTGKVIQKIEVPEDGEFLLEIEEVYGNPSTTIKITKPDGTEETIDMSNTNTIRVPAGATVEVTTQLQAGDSIGEIKVLKKETELNSTNIENNTPPKAEWITVKQDKYMYNNGGAGFWEKCLVNNVEVDETGIIIESEDAVKRIRIRYQASNGNTWSSAFTNIQDARNAQYLKVIVEYQVIEGNEYGNTNNNTIKIIINDGSWKATFVDEDGTELFSKYVYFENNSMQGSITLPKLTNTKEGKYFVGWEIDSNYYNAGEIYTLTKDETLVAVYIEITTPIINTTTTATSSVEDNSQAIGTTLYINFSATLNNGTECTIVNKNDNKTLPYAITKNVTHIYKVTGTYKGKTITTEIEVVVNKYQLAPESELMIRNGLIAYWPLKTSTSAEVLDDTIGDIIYTDSNSQPNFSNNAYSMNSANYLAINQGNNLSISSPKTFAFQIYLESIINGYWNILFGRQDRYSDSCYGVIIFDEFNGRTYNGRYGYGSDFNYPSGMSGKWINVVYTQDESGNTVLYFNGEVMCTDTRRNRCKYTDLFGVQC